jgi:hypothetical protein
MQQLGAEFAQAVRELDVNAPSRTAVALGRALHTLQDECAHRGINNLQHAWFSILDECEMPGASPDNRPGAAECARERTRAVMPLVAAALEQMGTERLEAVCPKSGAGRFGDCDRVSLPGVVGVCEFLDAHDEWDGIDRAWKPGAVATAMTAAFTAPLAGEPLPAAVCAGDGDIAAPPAAPVDVGSLDACFKLDLLCLGSIDRGDGASGPPPDDMGGCGVAGRSGPLGVIAILIAITGVRVSHRRRGRGSHRGG